MTAARAAASSLSTSGKVFFGSLCAGTFGLGCWQTQRYFEKVQQIATRQHELSLEPIVSCSVPDDLENAKHSSLSSSSFQRRRVQGTFRHDQEVLIGPRGPPLGALEAAAGGQPQGGGMASGPQGYYVVTPLDRTDATGGTVFVNRGWVPRRHVVAVGKKKKKKEEEDTAKSATTNATTTTTSKWARPTGTVQIEGILAKSEQPRFLTPVHDFASKPLQLFWIDASALARVAGVDQAVLLTELPSRNSTTDTTTTTTDTTTTRLLRPPLDRVGDFQTTPAIHAGYAVTWFGLSAAGLIMTRKLITRGRA